MVYTLCLSFGYININILVAYKSFSNLKLSELSLLFSSRVKDNFLGSSLDSHLCLNCKYYHFA